MRNYKRLLWTDVIKKTIKKYDIRRVSFDNARIRIVTRFLLISLNLTDLTQTPTYHWINRWCLRLRRFYVTTRNLSFSRRVRFGFIRHVIELLCHKSRRIEAMRSLHLPGFTWHCWLPRWIRSKKNIAKYAGCQDANVTRSPFYKATS